MKYVVEIPEKYIEEFTNREHLPFGPRLVTIITRELQINTNITRDEVIVKIPDQFGRT